MYFIVVGAGPVGRALAEVAIRDGHNVAVIEKDEARAERAVQALDARVYHVDIGAADVYDEVEFTTADAIAAVTEDDSDNLMAMVLAREAEIGNRISIVNEPGHRKLFERFDVHVLEDPERILARHLYGLVRHPRMLEFFPLPGRRLAFEIAVGENAAVTGRPIAELRSENILPEQMFVLSIERPTGDDDGSMRTVQPTAETVLRSGDRALVLAVDGVGDGQLDAFDAR